MPFGFHIFKTDAGWAQVLPARNSLGERMRVLKVGGAYQSATYLGERRFELPFEYFRVFERMFDVETQGFKIGRVLVIGGGGCALPKHIAATREDVSVDAIERDSRIAAIARKHFYISEVEERFPDRFRLVVDDGMHHLESCDAVYDAIVNDAFVGIDSDSGLLSPEGVALAKARLSAGGLYLVNIVAGDTLDEVDAMQTTLLTLEDAFENVHLLPATDETLSDVDNYIAVATDGDYEFAGSLS